MNITGYEITVPYSCANSAEKPAWSRSTSIFPSKAPTKNMASSMNMPPIPGR